MIVDVQHEEWHGLSAKLISDRRDKATDGHNREQLLLNLRKNIREQLLSLRDEGLLSMGTSLPLVKSSLGEWKG